MIEETIAIDDLYEDLYVVQKARKEGFTLGIEEGAWYHLSGICVHLCSSVVQNCFV